MNIGQYWISDVLYLEKGVSLKIMNTETGQTSYLGLDDNNHLQKYLSHLGKKDLELINHLRQLSRDMV